MAKPTTTEALWVNLQLAANLAEMIYKSFSRSVDLTVIEWHILLKLYQLDGQRPGDLARAVGRSPTSFTPSVDALAEKGLIRRDADPKDRRAVLIYLTQKGENLRQRIEESSAKLEERLNRNITKSELDMLKVFSEKLQSLKHE